MKPVDIIVLSWDRIDDTIEAIESACNQQGISPQVQVVDQGSKPDELQRLVEYCDTKENVFLCCNKKNAGVAGGRNQASDMGEANYIVALDNDAVFTDEWVCARAVDLMEADPSRGALAFQINLYDSPLDNPVIDESSWGYGPLTSAEWGFKVFNAKQFVGAGHMLRRDAFEKVGRYDARLFFMHEEVDLSDRLVNAGYRIEYRPDLAVRHKVSAEHRVLWKSGRYQMHLRNWIYINMKSKGVSFDTFSDLIVQTVGGLRLGFVSGSVKGFLGVLKMIPAANKERRENPYVQRTEAGAAYLSDVDVATGQKAEAPKPWADANKLWQLICRLRWETDLRAFFKHNT